MKNKEQLEDAYLSKAEFAKRAKISPRTVERLIGKILEENPDDPKIKREKKRRYKLHHSLMKRYVSEHYLKLEAKLRKLEMETKKLTNTNLEN